MGRRLPAFPVMFVSFAPAGQDHRRGADNRMTTSQKTLRRQASWLRSFGARLLNEPIPIRLLEMLQRLTVRS